MSKDSAEPCIPYVSGIIERDHEGRRQLLIQTRWKPDNDPLYHGTYEFVARVMDIAYQDVYETLRLAIKEEVGLTLKKLVNDSRTSIYHPQGTDASFAFRPFCCTQQLKEGRPWVGFVFRCQVEDEQPIPRQLDVRDPQWIDASEVKELFEASPEKFFTLEVAVWEYYFSEVVA